MNNALCSRDSNAAGMTELRLKRRSRGEEERGDVWRVERRGERVRRGERRGGQGGRGERRGSVGFGVTSS